MKYMNKKWTRMSIIAAVVVLVLIIVSWLIIKSQQPTESNQEQSVDTLALHVAVMPTLDCLPMFVADADSLFDEVGVSVVLDHFTAHMDCDTALAKGSSLIAFSDVIRAQRLIRKRVPLTFLSSTALSWKFITNKKSRVTDAKALKEKLVAVTRFSATDYLAESVVDSAKLKRDEVYRVQINDIGVRLKMLVNNELDGAILPEPQSEEALNYRHNLLVDFTKFNPSLGAIVMREDKMKNKNRQKQLDAFCKVYDMAVDSIKKYGVQHYGNLIRQYCKVKPSAVDSIKTVNFNKISPVPQSSITLAQEWLDKH